MQHSNSADKYEDNKRVLKNGMIWWFWQGMPNGSGTFFSFINHKYKYKP